MLPLFVFDGGAPALKRRVIQRRRERQEGQMVNATSTAQKLLAMQMQRGIKQSKPKRSKASTTAKAPSSPKTTDVGGVYFDDMPMQQPGAEVVAPAPSVAEPEKPFRRKDEYHLPDLERFTVRKGDLRVVTEPQEEDYQWDIVDGINIDTVDPSSAEFAELPMATQYMILSHLRLRSRLRLGYTKDQLEQLFPHSKDFSKFQIQQVQKRNYYTQKLMNVSGMDDDSGNRSRRIAGDKDREYVLVKNEDGWTLSLGTNEADAVEVEDVSFTTRSLPKLEPQPLEVKSVNSDSSDDLEDVPLTSNADTNSEFADRAVIESIYDRYKEEYDEPSPRKIKPNSIDIIKNIDSLSESELKRSVEEAKASFFSELKDEKNLQAEFQMGNSVLFGKLTTSDEPVQPYPAPASGTHTHREERQTHEVASDSSDSERPSELQTRKLPFWFKDTNQLSDAHQGIGFVTDKEPEHKPDEDEKIGLIPWNEAREYMTQVNEETQQHDSDVEIIEPDHSVDNTVEEVSEAHSPVTEQAEAPFLSISAEPAEVSDNSTIESASDDDALEVSDKSSPEPDSEAVAESSHRDSSEAVDQGTTVEPEQTRNAPKTPLIENITSGKRQVPKSSKAKRSGSKRPRPAKRAKKSSMLAYEFNLGDERELDQQLEEEEMQHQDFASTILMDQVPIHTTVTREQLLQEQLQKAKRDAEEVTQTMINDVQELLKRFGIPYITAPMEAEAQCAELFRLGLVDGIITDDSDCFLFGGSRVYKNMFNQKQFVECYYAEDIEHKVGLGREKLIELAMLLGSDYTEGVKGIGPVLAMEVLAEFGDLKQFKKWFDENTKTLTTKTERTKLEKNLLSRIKSGLLFLPDSFPEKVVREAYMRPEVDRDDSAFKWGVPLLDQIRTFLMYNVGWSQARVDEVMVPLIRNINKTRAEGTQSTVGQFFPQEYISYRKEAGMSKRMKVAANRLRNT